MRNWAKMLIRMSNIKSGMSIVAYPQQKKSEVTKVTGRMD